MSRTGWRCALLYLRARRFLRRWSGGLGSGVLYLRRGARGFSWARLLRGWALLDLRCRTCGLRGLSGTSLLLWLRTTWLRWLWVLLVGGGAILFRTNRLAGSGIALRLVGMLRCCGGVGALGFYGALLNGALLLLTNCGRCGRDTERGYGASRCDLNWLAVVG